MKIKTKLLLGLSALPILLVILIVISLFQISKLKEMSETLLANYEKTVLSESIHRDIKDEAIHLRNLVVSDDQETIKKEIKSLQEKQEAVKQNIALLESKLITDDHRNWLLKLRDTNNRYNDYLDEVLTLTLAGKDNEALVLIGENSIEMHEEFFLITSDFTDVLETNMHSSVDTLTKDFQREIIISLLILSVAIIFIIALLANNFWKISERLKKVSQAMSNVANGKADLGTKVEDDSPDEIGDVVQSFNRMAMSLEEQMTKEQELTWSKANLAEITTSLSGTHDVETLATTFLSKVVPLVEANQAVFYVKEIVNDQEPVYKLLGSYAFKERKHVTNIIRLGEGLIGQAVLEKSPIILTEVPSDYIRVTSGLGEAAPVNVYVLPIIFEGDVKAVLELASFKSFTPSQQSFLEELMSDLGIILESVMGRIQLAKLLEESQTLMEEVQAQSEELQSQQEELRATNEELEEQTQALRQSEEKLQVQQEELEQTNADLEEKAKSLEEQNKRFEQTNREVEKARAELEEKAKQLALSSKYKSEFLANMSHELRTPLNSLLILSKLLADNADGNLSAKQVEYSKTIYTSGNDLLALINDILDLAKIESGKMEVNPTQVHIKEMTEFVKNNFRPVADQKGIDFQIIIKEDVPTYIYSDMTRIQQVLKNLLSNAFKFTKEGEVRLEISLHSKVKNQSVLAFAVKDTGIGIASDKLDLIFEAFQQADGTTSRKFGGTGLGLSISREIAALLNGTLEVKSSIGRGTTFTLYVGDYEEKDNLLVHPINEVATTIETSETVEKPAPPKQKLGAVFNNIDNDIKRLLIVDDDKVQRNSLMELIGDMDIVITAVSTGHEAIEQLKLHQFDCVILDLGLSDTSGFELLDKIKEMELNNDLRVFIYTGRDLTLKEEIQLNKYAHTIIIKDGRSPQRLKAELELFFKNSDKQIQPDPLPKKVEELSNLEGKKILLVDDDVRNVYALSSILELYGVDISFAENGKEGLEILQKNPDIDLVLMDIMMPEMDGYEAIQRLRAISTFVNLPVIALTAKAMKEDREKCMEVGASDYIVKPIDPDQLISLIKVWLYEDGKWN
ncbi:response regulator [Lederbergia graminis]|uniref:histidine kinase n=1 Tax=Lederbergia graminis TaxID=735518 RepID=A0ABW0LKT8_9BACI